MKQDIVLNTDGSGNVSFEIKLAPYFTEVISQLSELAPSENQNKLTEGQFFDVDKIREDFSKRSGVILESVESPSPEVLKGSFLFSDINTAVTDGGKTRNPGIFSFTNNGGTAFLSVKVNYETMEQLLNENLSLNNPLMENFGPLANRDLSKSDYLDMMEYMLGPESRQGIKDSYIDITVKVNGKIITQKGGSLKGNDAVEFRIPLIKILVLEEPLEYSVFFR